ncbi:hypothetical protein CCS01_21655 [Rhodopila globiformis]|uniref:Uncharacterized protein n=1 Tax=Rhodopila globiformis TaxID=1071 RepID=A0A2S6N494_RHOGL|nr:hypothetical protein CCS01_21655 [Rhodopila globiformis]
MRIPLLPFVASGARPRCTRRFQFSRVRYAVRDLPERLPMMARRAASTAVLPAGRLCWRTRGTEADDTFTPIRKPVSARVPDARIEAEPEAARRQADGTSMRRS